MYIAYISSPAGVKINQIHDITDLSIENKLNDIGSASFSIGITNQANNYDVLQEFNQIEIYKQVGSTEKKMFEGVIKGALANNNITTIYAKDYNYLLQSKFIYANKSYSGETPEFIISDILTEINARYDTHIILDCGITDILPDKTYNEGQDFLTIIKDISDSGYEFKVENKILKFKAIVGSDKSIPGGNYFEYSFDKDNIDARNISNPTSEYNADNIANQVKLKDGTSTFNDSDSGSILQYGSVEKILTSSGGNTQTINELLMERKNSVKEISFIPKSKDFFEVDLGDIIKVYINSPNPLNYYLGTAKIIEKSYKSGNISQIDVKVSISKVKTLSFLEKFQKLDSRVKNIEI